MKAHPYAEGTKVSVKKSRDEIERILERYGSTAFGYIRNEKLAAISFTANGHQIRFQMPIPPVQSEEMRRWRALALCIKSKLEAVNSKIVSFDDEFLAHIVMPDGRTVAESLAEPMRLAITQGVPLLEHRDP